VFYFKLFRPMECEQLLRKSQKLIAGFQKMIFHCLAKSMNNLLLSLPRDKMLRLSVFKEEIKLHKKYVICKKGITFTLY